MIEKIGYYQNLTYYIPYQYELLVYFSLSESKYKIYDKENNLLSIIDITDTRIFSDKLSRFISSETKKFIRNKKLEQLLDGK